LSKNLAIQATMMSAGMRTNHHLKKEVPAAIRNTMTLREEINFSLKSQGNEGTNQVASRSPIRNNSLVICHEEDERDD
jgi:hypothetical protein